MSKFPFVGALQIMYSFDSTDSIKDCVSKWVFGIRRFLPRSTRTAKFAQDVGPRVQAPMRFLLAPVVAALCTPIELPRLHHQGDK